MGIDVRSLCLTLLTQGLQMMANETHSVTLSAVSAIGLLVLAAQSQALAIGVGASQVLNVN